MGVSVGLADVADRIDGLRRVPTAVRFLSCAPQVSALAAQYLVGIGWVIVGGKFGPLARPWSQLGQTNFRE